MDMVIKKSHQGAWCRGRETPTHSPSVQLAPLVELEAPRATCCSGLSQDFPSSRGHLRHCGNQANLLNSTLVAPNH